MKTHSTFTTAVLISLLLLSLALIFLAIVNVIYVGYFLKSESAISPIQIIFSPVLAVVGAFFLAVFFETQKINAIGIPYEKFRERVHEKKYVSNATSFFFLSLVFFAFPITIKSNANYRFQAWTESIWFYVFSNVLFVILFFSVSFVLGTVVIDRLKITLGKK